MERSSWITARAAEVAEQYERCTGRVLFGSERGTLAAVLEEVAEVCCGLEVIDYTSLPDGVLGEMDPDEGTICVRPGMDPLRRTFVVAHEIGHSALEHPGRIVDREEHLDERAGPDKLEAQEGVHRAYNSRALIEVEANLFAAELLVPTKILSTTIVEDRRWAVEGLAEKFGVSRTAMLARLSNALLLRGNAELGEGASEKGQTTEATTPDLDRDQAEAVAVEAPALVVAGPGAGKTRVLSERYVSVVRSGVAEDSVLALTFSNKAAEEMRSRVSRMLGGGYRGVQTYTFHGFCMELLKDYHHLVGLPEDFALLTETDALLLVRGRLSELDLSHLEQLSDPGLYVPGILAAVSRAKDELKGPAEFGTLARRWQETAEEGEEQAKAAQALEASVVYAAYEGWLREHGYVDYGDLVWKGLKVLEHPQAAEEVRAQYEQVLVDEFQDINFASGRLLRALDGGRGVVWAVADPDQSIYGFRGASAANLERFEDDYPGHRPVYLTKNYRSGPDIVGASHGLRGRGGSGDGDAAPPLEATRRPPRRPAVSLVEAPDEETELRYIVEEVRRRNEAGVRLREQAVLCATNGQAKKVTTRLSAAGIAAQGPTTLLGSEEIKNALSTVSLLRGSNGAGLLGIAAHEESPLTEQDVVKVLAWAKQQNCSAREAISRSAEIGDLADAAAGSLAELDGLLNELPAWGDAWHAVLAYAFHPRSGIRELLYDGTDEALRRLSQLGQLAVLARSFVERGGLVEREGIPGFVDYVGELAASRRGEGALYSPPASDAVQVMTVHKSKGLEFPVVYVPNLVTRRFPGGVAGEGEVTLPPGLSRDENLLDPEEEVRCLFYVALTRAEDELVLTRAETYGNRARPLPLMDRLVRMAGERTMVAERRLEPYSSNGDAPTSGSIVRVGGGRRKAAYSFRELRSYDRCSLQYKFAEILGLPERDSAYRAFHNSVYRTLGDMEVEAERYGRNPSLARVKERLVKIWEEEGPACHFYETVYRRRAETVIQNWQASEGALRWRIRQKLALPGPDGTEIEVTVDAIRHDEEGGIVLARHMFGRPRKGHTEKDHLDLYSLYLAAAREAWPGKEARVVLRYLTLDESVDVRVTEKVMANRTGKMENHVQGVLAGRFPPKPGRACKSCPWNLFCRASA